MPQTMVGFLSADPIVVAVANVGAWIGAAILVFQGGRKAYKAGAYIYHNSVKSWLKMEREDRENRADQLSDDAILLSAYTTRNSLRLGLSVFYSAMFPLILTWLSVSQRNGPVSTFDRALIYMGTSVSIAMVSFTMGQGLALYLMMDKTLKMRSDKLLRQNQEKMWEV